MSGDSTFRARIDGEFHKSNQEGHDIEWHASWLKQRIEEMLKDFDPEVSVESLDLEVQDGE